MANEPPVFNAATALARLGGDQRLFKDLIRFFHEDSPGLLARLQAAISAADAFRLTRAAHSLKSLVANFDAAAATASAERLEVLGLSGDLQDASAELEQLTALVAELDRELAAYSKAT